MARQRQDGWGSMANRSHAAGGVTLDSDFEATLGIAQNKATDLGAAALDPLLRKGLRNPLLPTGVARTSASSVRQVSEDEPLEMWLVGVSALLVSLCASAAWSGYSTANPLIQDDVVVLGVLMLTLKLIFGATSSKHPALQSFMRFTPSLLLAYFLPAVLSAAGVLSSKHSKLPDAAARFLLPASLTLLTLSTDLMSISALGPRVLWCFFAATGSIIIAGPFSMLIVGAWDRNLVGGQTWQGLASMAGSWIGGSANQLAMKEVFEVSDETFSKVICVDVFVSNVWMAFLLACVPYAADIDRFCRADSRPVAQLAAKLETYNVETSRITTFSDFSTLGLMSFGTAGAATWMGRVIGNWLSLNAPALHKVSLDSPAFWTVSLVTSIAVALSCTRFRDMEGAGASKLGSYMVFVLIATLGMRLDITALRDVPGLLAVAFVWICCHGMILFLVAFATKSPFFFVALGSQANIGGAASAPIVAAAFNQALAPVGVLLAVIGYSIGTIGAYCTGIGLRAVARSLGVDDTLLQVVQPQQ